jgi:hypothetical protein
MRVKTSLVATAILVGLSGSARASDPYEDAINLLERQASDVDSVKPDCDKMLDKLLAHVEDDAKVVQRARAADKGKSKEQLKKDQATFEARYAARGRAAKKKLAPLEACRANPRMKTWRAKLEGRP